MHCCFFSGYEKVPLASNENVFVEIKSQPIEMSDISHHHGDEEEQNKTTNKQQGLSPSIINLFFSRPVFMVDFCVFNFGLGKKNK